MRECGVPFSCLYFVRLKSVPIGRFGSLDYTISVLGRGALNSGVWYSTVPVTARRYGSGLSVTIYRFLSWRY